MAVALGGRAPGLAHRVLGDGPRALGEGSTCTAAGSTWSSRTTRTSARRARAPAVPVRAHAGCTTGCCELAGDKMSKSLGNVERLRDALDRVGPETLLLLFAAGALPHRRLDYRRRTLEQAQAVGERLREALERAALRARRRRPEAGERLATSAGRRGRRSTRPWPTTSTRRRPWRCCTGWRATLNAGGGVGGAAGRARGGRRDLLVAASTCSAWPALDPGRQPGTAPAEVAALAEERERPAPRATSPAPTRCATRSRRSAGSSATRRRAPSSSRAA